MEAATMPSRRSVLKAAGATLIVAGITPAGEIFGHGRAWAAQATNLNPETFATLVQMSRDIYPHPNLGDEIYAAAVGGLDAAAKDDADLKKMLEEGAAGLGGYSAEAGEDARMAKLKEMEATPFFQKVRSNLVTGIYNNQAVWPVFGYEGESASKGGYISRGFDDIDWV